MKNSEKQINLLEDSVSWDSVVSLPCSGAPVLYAGIVQKHNSYWKVIAV